MKCVTEILKGIDKMNQEVKQIAFYDDTLIGLKDNDNQLWLGVKQACLNIGLSEGQADRQIKNLQSDLVFQNSVVNLSVKFDGQVRNTICIKEDFVTLWLAKIRLTPTMQRDNPKAVEKLIKYQLEAQKVLHNAFMGTKEHQMQFYNNVGLEELMKRIDARITTQEDTITSCAAIFQNMIEYSTINYKQSQRLLQAARKRINILLGGAHSKEYKEYSRMYFKNLWQDFCNVFECGSYKDLNPLYMDDDVAIKWISEWEYTK